MKRNLFITILFTSVFPVVFGQESRKGALKDSKQKNTFSPELYDEIAHMDSVLFEAFNKQDKEKFKSLFTDDLEFYQNNKGLELYNKVMKDFNDIFKQENIIHRELIKGSLEVYPIKNYGAIETGEHQFCYHENGQQVCGTFKFVHIWQKKDGQWKISRVISYDH